ncbi:hypothetical protein [Microbaculum marinum]|uniref:Uncharacterized protein n=1 Tax=Microbaculum marinum TaxID=1764581 RepID=A0AAW9RWJ2_9HYPH
MSGHFSEAAGPAAPKVLLIGFSNTAMPTGYATVLKYDFARECPGGEIVRVGLGALQPFAIPPFVRLADRQHGPFSHVLFEVNTSAFAIHPYRTEAIARELLADMVLTTREIGAGPAFLVLYRDFGGKVVVDFNAITRAFCAEYGIPVLDLAEGLIAEVGEHFVRSLVRDGVHTTTHGTRFQAERALPFLLEFVNAPLRPGASPAGKPVRRRFLDLADLLPELRHERVSLSNLELDLVLLGDGQTASLDLGRERLLEGIVHLYHLGGGRADIRLDDREAATVLTSIDRFSYYTRIGVQGFNAFRGERASKVRIDGVRAARDVALDRTPRDGEASPSVRQRLGPLLIAERDD